MPLRHVLTIDDLSTEVISNLIQRADQIKQSGFQPTLKKRLIGSLFFEPSTRTRLSFEAAVKRTGGNVIGFSDSGTTSTTKGESLEDTIAVASSYSDCIIMRHPEVGSAARAATVSGVPIINAGDGPNAHPTQTLLDLFTIQEIRGSLDNFTITLVGDLLYSRVAHSLASVLMRYTNVTQYWIAPSELRMPDEIRIRAVERGANVIEQEVYQDILPETDILVMTRVQKERFADAATYDRLKANYILRKADLAAAKPSMRILSPLPRLYELPTEIDTTPYAYYFQQAANGVPVRAALLDYVLNG